MEQQFSSLDGVMEPETISKNGASSKSLMSRGNKLFSLLLLISITFISSCTNEPFEILQKTDSHIFMLGSSGKTYDITNEYDEKLSVYECSEWFTITESQIDNKQVFHIVVPDNKTGVARTGSATISINSSDSRKVTQISIIIAVIQYATDDYVQ